MKSVLFGMLGAGALSVGVICGPCNDPISSAPALVPVVAEFPVMAAVNRPAIVTLRVEGMTCGGCAISARIVLERLEGVEKAKVDYERKLAYVTYETTKVTPEQMIAALKAKLQYKATVVVEKTA